MSWFLRALEGIPEVLEEAAEWAQRATVHFLRMLEKAWEEVDRFMTGKSPEVTQLRFYVYFDSRNQYRWRLLAKNRKVIADSGESYKEKRNCLKTIRLIANSAADAIVEDRTK